MSDESDVRGGTVYLERSKMLPVEGVVYCLEHGAVHDDTTDPYRYGEPDCKEAEHRPVYYRARKGDVDETQPDEPGEPEEPEVRFVGSEQTGEVTVVGEPPEGAAVVDDLSGVQERMTRRIIGERAADELNEEETGFLAGLVRLQVRKVEKNRVGARKLFGDEYDPAQHDAKMTFLERVYRKLGKDPERITGRRTEPR